MKATFNEKGQQLTLTSTTTSEAFILGRVAGRLPRNSVRNEPVGDDARSIVVDVADLVRLAADER